MKRITLFILLAVSATLLASCGGPAAYNAANTANTNTAKPAAPAPTADALLAIDKQANEAYFKGDTKFFEGVMSDKFVMHESGHRIDKAASIKMIGGMKCDVKEWKLDEPQMAMIDADTAALSYKGTFDGTCTGEDGKAVKAPSPIRGVTVYTRAGDKWLAAFHGENLIIDPKAPPAKPDAKKDEPKKDEAKKDDAKHDDKAAANSASTDAPAKPVADPNTEAIVKLHGLGWEAWKAKDAKKFEEMTTANLAIVGPIGNWVSGKAAVIKLWTEMKCEGVNNVKVADGIASALSPTVEILTLKGTADGTCEGQKNGDLYQTAFYVKEADAWKLAFMFEALAM